MGYQGWSKYLSLLVIYILITILLLPGCGSKEEEEATTVPETMSPETTSAEMSTSPDTTEPSSTSVSTPTTPATTEEPKTPVIPPPPETTEIPEGTPRGWQAVYTEIYFNDFESAKYPGVIVNGERITDGALDGKNSIRLNEYEGIETDPAILPLASDNYYIFEFDYHLLNTGAEMVLWTNLRPEGSNEESDSVVCQGLLPNAEAHGTCSFGALTPDAANYYLTINAAAGTEIVIDNFKIFRLDSIAITSPPDRWANLGELPYPRLGNNLCGDTKHWAQGSDMAPDAAEGGLIYRMEDIIEKLAMFDVVAGPDTKIQSTTTDFVKRLRELNPDIVVVTYKGYGETLNLIESPHATIDLNYDFYSEMPEEWRAKFTNGSDVVFPNMPGRFLTNIFESCPPVRGQTFTEAIIDFIVNTILASGLWDGLFIDNAHPNVSHYIPNCQEPSLIDFDVNLNGQRDETPAQISEATREGWLSFWQKLRAKVGNNEIFIGNCGFTPSRCFTPYVNGFLFELFLNPWFCFSSLQPNESAWRRTLDLYLYAQENTLAPHLSILEGTGCPCDSCPWDTPEDRNYLEATTEDFYRQRLGLGTALLGDGFYEYDLYDNRSVPYWFDEYTVNEDGVAVEDAKYKGYLGIPLGEAVELVSPATLVWEEDFRNGSLPSEIEADAGAYVSNGVLVIDNPVHTAYRQKVKVNTKAGEIPFRKGETYVVEFDWEILETIDDRFSVSVAGSEGKLGSYELPEVFAGESGSIHFPVTLNYGNSFELEFTLYSGGGKIAIDNIRVYEGGAGPWRRDFENGIVLVNPLNKAYTFSADELAGEFERTGIKRIRGTQAPGVNSGQSVDGTLTLQPFDAIILLADHHAKSG